MEVIPVLSRGHSRYRPVAALYSAAVLADSPLAYWRLGESSGTTATDSSGNGRNATYEGGYTLGQAGAVSGDTAVLLNGSDAKAVSGAEAAFTLTGFTYETWLKTTSANLNVFFTQGAVAQWFGINGRKLTLGTLATSSASIDDDQWHHCVATVSAGGSIKLYVDGVEDGTGSTSGSVSGAVTLGAFAASGFWFPGSLDEAAIYSGALSAARVLAHYNAA